MRPELQKLAGDLQGILKTSSTHMSKLAKSYAELMATHQQQDHELKAYKIARRMEQRGLSPHLDFEEKVAKLLETPVEKLATYEQAVELAASGFRLGAVPAEEPVHESGESVRTVDPLDAFIASNAALS